MSQKIEISLIKIAENKINLMAKVVNILSKMGNPMVAILILMVGSGKQKHRLGRNPSQKESPRAPHSGSFMTVTSWGRTQNIVQSGLSSNLRKWMDTNRIQVWYIYLHLPKKTPTYPRG